MRTCFKEFEQICLLLVKYKCSVKLKSNFCDSFEVLVKKFLMGISKFEPLV